MDALYFGSRCKPGATCLGSGPWVAADLENGLYQSADAGNDKLSYRGNPTPFVTAFLKNDGHTFFELRSGDAQKGPLTQIYHGPLPTAKPGYVPMQQEGGIVLGTGGDNSNRNTGLFFEGWMTKSLVSTASLDAIQATLTRFKLAAQPPDLVVSIPRNAGAFYEFHRAPELIELGRMRTRAALVQWRGHVSVEGAPEVS